MGGGVRAVWGGGIREGHDRGAVVDAARVARRRGAAWTEGRAQPGQPLLGEPGAGPLVPDDTDDRHDLRVETAGVHGRDGAGGGAGGGPVLLRAGDPELAREVIRGGPHVGSPDARRSERCPLIADRFGAPGGGAGPPRPP